MVSHDSGHVFIMKAILYDMDGVLMMSSSIHAAAYATVFSTLGIQDFTYERFAGMRTRDTIRLVLRDHHIIVEESAIERLAKLKSEIALDNLRRENPVVPGCREILSSHSERYALALASSASQSTVHLFLELNGLAPYFRCVVHGGEVRNGKPDPEIYQLAMSRLGIAPTNVLVIEDAVAGVLAARAAGAVVCGVTGTCDAESLRKAGANCVVESLQDIQELL